jgi:two-component system cell cycle sensor histidine kinase PleC
MFTPWQHRARSGNLLASYCETLGYMQLRAQKEMALEIARLEAELASRTKSEFLANMSHELRTPLNAIIGFSELIQHLGVEKTAKNVEYASNIADAGRHLLNVVSDILDIAKIESGTATPALERHDVGALIASSVLLVRERIEQKGQRLDVRVAPTIPAVVVDGRRIKQIVINLLTNAQKYTPPQGKIAIEATRNVEEGVEVSVTDTGPGMSAEEIQVAMKPFGQVRAHSLHSHSGTGLGLPIAAALARQHGGDLQVASIVGKGTTVTLVLPGACVVSDNEPSLTRPPALARTNAPPHARAALPT